MFDLSAVPAAEALTPEQRALEAMITAALAFVKQPSIATAAPMDRAAIDLHKSLVTSVGALALKVANEKYLRTQAVCALMQPHFMR